MVFGAHSFRWLYNLLSDRHVLFRSYVSIMALLHYTIENGQDCNGKGIVVEFSRAYRF